MMQKTAAAGIILCAFAQTSWADDICPRIETLLTASQSQFKGVDLTQTQLAATETCGISTDHTGVKQLSCRWSFDYRAVQATQDFDALQTTLQGCLMDRATVLKDLPVNHPDFYDLRQYQLPRALVSLSLKDKATLNRTFVFFHVKPNS